MRKTPLEALTRVARMYKSNSDASRALGITPQAFARLCRQHSIETPHARRIGRPAHAQA